MDDTGRWIEEAFRLSDEGKLAEAITAAKRAIAADPESSCAHSLLGILYERAGQREQAIEAYEAVLHLTPESAPEGLEPQAAVPREVAEEARHVGDQAPPLGPPRADQAPFPGPPSAGAPPLPTPASPTHRGAADKPERSIAMWSGVAVLAIAFIVLLLAAVRVWRGAPQVTTGPSAASGGARRAARAPAGSEPSRPGAPAPAPAPSAVAQAPTPATAPLVPPTEPAGVRAASAEGTMPPTPASAIAALATTPPSAARTAPVGSRRGPVVSITVPAPDAYIASESAAASPEAAPPPSASLRAENRAAQPVPSEPRPVGVAPPTAPARSLPGAEGARARYFQGDLGGAIRSYESIIAENSGATPQNYQQLGWFYYQAGRTGEAAGAYRESLTRYQQQLSAGQDVEAARHGIRTAEAALRVIDAESGAR